jgi:hypothetical protein
MSTQHTPGPWQYAFGGGTAAFLVEADGTTVARLSVTENSPAHSALAANARLLASAPDLLAALQNLTRLSIWDAHASEYDREQLDAARAAIARATEEA